MSLEAVARKKVPRWAKGSRLLGRALEVLEKVYEPSLLQEGSVGSNAVMLLLQQIQNDAKVLQTQAEADLKAAVTDFEQFKNDAQEQSLVDLGVEKSETQADLLEASAEAKDLEKELLALGKTKTALKEECDFLLGNFDLRQEAREQEMFNLRDGGLGYCQVHPQWHEGGAPCCLSAGVQRCRWLQTVSGLAAVFAGLVILRWSRQSFLDGLHNDAPLLDMDGLIRLSTDLNPGKDLLSLANEPFKRYVNRSLEGWHLPKADDVAANVGIAACVVDTGQALFQLGQGLMAFNAASNICIPEDQSEEAKQACAVALAYGLAGVMWSVSFTSLAISDCAASLDLQAACSADVTSLMGSFTYLASSISAMTLDCPAGPLNDTAANIAENSGGGLRRLAVGDTIMKIKTLEANQAAKQAAKATCFFDVGHAAFWLSRVGTSITQATLHCTEKNLASEGDAGKVSCAVDVSGIVGAATFATSTILLAVAGCPAILDADGFLFLESLR
eukprot:symbB.v1.2.012835.t3/scaffold887.1/size155094/2